MSTRSTLVLRGVHVARAVPPGLWLAARPAIAAGLSLSPRVGKALREAMRAGLGPDAGTPAQSRAYFRHAADLLAFSAIVYRERGLTGALDRLWTHDPAGEAIYREALGRGKGIVMVGGHFMGHEILAATAPRDFGMTVLVRKAPDPQYEAIKQEWYASLGLNVVPRPPRNAPGGGLAEITSALRVLRQNRVLAITPDLIRKPGTGIPVTFLGRTVDLPAGAFFLAYRSGAALIPTFAQEERGVYRMWCHAPLEPDPDLDRDSAVADLAQRWATVFEAFVRERPDMWQFWLDKRWRQWLLSPDPPAAA